MSYPAFYKQAGDEKPMFSARTLSQLKSFIPAGLAIGGGAGLLVALINHLKYNNEANDTSKDDDEMRIKVKSASADDGSIIGDIAGTGVALGGGVAATIGAYALVKKLYSIMRKRKAQEELDAAQEAMLNAQGFEKAGGIGGGDLVLGSAVALPLLLALASGVVAYKGLDKVFPKVKHAPKPPKRIVIADAAEKSEDDAVDDYNEKAAAFNAAMRVLIDPEDRDSDINNLIGAIANGEASSFKTAAMNIGFLNALDTVKNASARPVLPAARHVATSYIAKSAYVSAPAQVIFAAEVASKYPDMYKYACSLDEATQDNLVELMAIVGRATENELNEEFGLTTYLKQANIREEAMDYFTGVMKDKLTQKGDTFAEEEGTEDSGDDADTEGASASDTEEDRVKKNRPKVVFTGAKAKAILGNGDIIDKILNPTLRG